MLLYATSTVGEERVGFTGRVLVGSRTQEWSRGSCLRFPAEGGVGGVEKGRSRPYKNTNRMMRENGTGGRNPVVCFFHFPRWMKIVFSRRRNPISGQGTNPCKTRL